MNRARYTWIKLYTEIVSDPKMGLMEDRLWRRTVELFMLAGRHGLGGVLPPVEDTAWILRTTKDDIDKALEELQSLEIVNRLEDGNWNVSHFSVRQAAMPSSERQRKHRETKHNLSQELKKS